MNPQTENTAPLPVPDVSEAFAGQPAPSPLPPDSAPNNAPDPTHPPRRPRGKIARLPKATRDKLNLMLRDGLRYADIIHKLGDDAQDLIPRNLSDWHSSPAYQHWLLEQDWFEDLRAQQEPAFDLLTDFDTSKFNEAALQLAVTRLFSALRHLESSDLNDQLGGNARTFAALVHALSRACRETTNIEKFRAECAQAVAAELKQLNIDRELSDNEYDLVVNKLDQVFKTARRQTPRPPSPSVTNP